MMKPIKVKKIIKKEEQERLSFLRKFERVTQTPLSELALRDFEDKRVVWVNGKPSKKDVFSSFYYFEEKDFSSLNNLLNQIHCRVQKILSMPNGLKLLAPLDDVRRSIIYTVEKDVDSECYKSNELFKRITQKIALPIYDISYPEYYDQLEGVKKWARFYDRIIKLPEFAQFSDIIKRNYITFNTAFQYVYEYSHAYRSEKPRAVGDYIEFIMHTYELASGNKASSYRNVPAFIRNGNWEPVDYQNISSSMEILADWVLFDKESKRIHPIEKAAIMHCELVRIQAFPDGNHRMARLIANGHLMENDLPAIAIDFDKRKEYNKATNEAIEKHDVTNLIGIFYDSVTKTVLDTVECLDEIEKKISKTSIKEDREK